MQNICKKNRKYVEFNKILKNTKTTRKLKVNFIIDKNSITIYDENKNKAVYEIEEKYENTDYIRISKSSIVNLNKIKSIRPDFGGKILATMENNEKIYISRQYVPILKKKLGIGGN